MSEPVGTGRRAVNLCAAAALGAAAGLFVGWLLFGRQAPPPPGGNITVPAARPAETARLAKGVEALSGEVKALSEAVRRLADSRAAAGAHREEARAGPQPGRAPRRIAPGVKFHDTFETGTDGWFVARFAPVVIGEVTRTEGEGRAKEGKGALALSYVLEPGKIPLALRTSTGINRLSLWIRTLERPAEVIVGVQERDESDYHTMVHLEPAEGWKRFEFDLAEFVLGDDSEDENGKLDFHQIRSVAVVDAAGLLGGEGENVLLLDEVRGEYRAEEPAVEAGAQERF